MAITKTVEESLLSTEKPIDKINKMLIRYDLTPNQAKVYLFLSKNGIKTASEITKSLKLPRTETYHLLSVLQQKGIIFSIIGKPTKFNAVEIEKSLEILINNEKNRISELESEKEAVTRLWYEIPRYSEFKDERKNKFQPLQEQNSILIQLERMVKESKENVLVLGTELDFKKFHTEFGKLLNKTKTELKILTDLSFEESSLFEDISIKKIKKIEDINREDFCFIIKDDSEAIFFISNKGSRDRLAVWTNSKKFITALRSLFSLMWNKSNHIDETDSESILSSEITYEHRLREIEHEKRILNYLQENSQLSRTNE